MMEITKENFEKEVKQSTMPVIIDFFASWCGPCQLLGPVFEELSKDYEGKLKFGKVDTEKEKIIAGSFDIRSIPCVVVLKEGKEVTRIVGFAGKDELKAKIDAIVNEL